MRILLVLVCVLFSGCAYTRSVQLQRVKNMSIEFKGEVSESAEAFALHSVRHILEAWTADHGIKPRPGRIRIELGKFIRKNDKRVGGYYRHSEQLMVVSSGRKWTLPSLYHELCHMNYAQYDVNHVHKKWPWWNWRGKQINREIRRCCRSWWWRGRFCQAQKKLSCSPLSRRADTPSGFPAGSSPSATL